MKCTETKSTIIICRGQSTLRRYRLFTPPVRAHSATLSSDLRSLPVVFYDGCIEKISRQRHRSLQLDTLKLTFIFHLKLFIGAFVEVGMERGSRRRGEDDVITLVHSPRGLCGTFTLASFTNFRGITSASRLQETYGDRGTKEKSVSLLFGYFWLIMYSFCSVFYDL